MSFRIGVRVRRDRSVSVFYDWEDIQTRLFEIFHNVEMEPLTFSYQLIGLQLGETLGCNYTAITKSVSKEFEIRFLKEAFCWSFWIGTIVNTDQLLTYESVMITSNVFL